MTRHLLWNHVVHERWGKSRLCFWRLQFMPTYSPHTIEEIRRVVTDAGVTAFSLYETFGSYDILLRCWVPTSLSVDGLDAMLHAGLREFDLHTTDFFEVVEELRHWGWVNKGGEPIAVDPTVLESYDRQSILRLDAIKDRSARGAALDPQEGRDLSEATRRHLIKEMTPSEGMRFVVVLTSPIGSMPTPARRHLRTEVLEIVDDASQAGITDVSIYVGHGFGEVLLLARSPSDRFYPLVRDLVNNIGGMALAVNYSMRTFTAVAATPTFEVLLDKIAGSAGLHVEQTIEDLLTQNESERLEFKSSVYADLGKALVAGSADDLVQEPGILQSVTKTVCAFMNSEAGGSIVVGVLELDEFIRREEKKNPGLDVGANIERLVPSRPVGPNRVLPVGIGWDLQVLGLSTWDAYSRKLQDVFGRSIEPHPIPWMSFRTEEISGQVLLCIDVRPMSRGWAYVVEPGSRGKSFRFYVREYGKSEEYVGPFADNYKQSSLRPD